jgi:hypothetical protein
MDYQKSQTLGSFGTPGRSRAGAAARSSDANSVVSRTRGREVKALFDSSYVKPEHNYRVVQDHNPVKQATLHLARERFEKDLAVKNQLQDAVMDYHFNKIETDKRQCEQERHAKKQKQLRFKATMEE